MDKSEFEGSPKTWPPLGMPTGSVRALLLLMVVAVVVQKMVRGDSFENEHDLLWVLALVISLTHYFTARRYVPLSRDLRRRLEDDGVIERERHPLFLPRNSVRIIIVGAFGWVAYYLFINNRIYEHHAASLLGMMAAFLLGALSHAISHWWSGRSDHTSTGTWGDLKAITVLAAVLIVAIPEFLDRQGVFPPEFNRVALGLMLFYIGSR